MKEFWKERIFYVSILCGFLILVELVTNWRFLGLFGAGFFLMTASLYVKSCWLNRLCLGFGLLLVLLTIILTKSFWLLTLTVFLALIIFQREDIHELGNLSESILHPLREEPGEYHGIKLIQPQSNQRTILEHTSLFDLRESNQTTFEWDDINMVYVGGNSIIDLGNTIVPAGQHTVMIRKLFGRIRLIIPRDIGLSLNISLVTGRVLFESQEYQLTMENFKWRSPDYPDANRKLSLVVSSVIGDVEVIML